MVYCAVHYVSVNGKMFTPGEVITEEMTNEKVEWLMSKGALKMIGAPAAFPADKASKDADDSSKDADDSVKDADGSGDPPPTEEDEEEAPEIDITDSVIPATAEEPKKTIKGGRKK